MTLPVLSAGAAKGVVTALRPAFRESAGIDLDARFGAVGAMRANLLNGIPCDVLILTRTLIDDLTADGRLRPGSVASLGQVKTGLAVRSGDPAPDVSTHDSLRRSLLDAHEIYLPDPERSTGGIHFVKVLRSLGIYDQVAPCLRPYPNGATAMAQLAQSREPVAIGCTQLTEVLYTDGVELIATLPGELGLTTLYTAAVTATAAQPDQAQLLVTMLTSEFSRRIRQDGGFAL